MINAIIIDDEPNSVFTLDSFIKEHCNEVNIVGSAGNVKSGKELIEDIRPQLVFLDIEMPFGSGFDLLRSLDKITFEIIFITAYNQYALAAFRFSAIDYLLKPIRIAHLKDAVKKAEQRIQEKKAVFNYEQMLHNMQEKDPRKQKLGVLHRGEHIMLQLDEIMYLIADGKYTRIHVKGKNYLMLKNLKDFEEMLPTSIFCRIHYGHIINIDCVSKIQKGRGGNVVMRDGTELEIAVRRKDEFMKLVQHEN
ncbi:MAG: response regulator transcription factor [Taibaiella sp.]|nr:response regulator transcription factor [Taibaiella sp.]